MAKQLWFPGADRSQTFDAKYPGQVADRIDVALLHSTEGDSWPSYNGGASAPNMTIGFDYATKTVQYRQHFQANRSARALAGSVNGTSTNRFHVFQIEIRGTSGWASSENPRAPYRLPDYKIVRNFADWQLEGIARVLRWLNVEWGVPMVAPFQFVPWQRDNRMTAAQWSAFKGVCGHQHVPANDHTDPGAINIGRLLELAKVAAAAKPSTPAPKPDPIAPKPQPLPSTGVNNQEDDMPTPADLWNHKIPNLAADPDPKTGKRPDATAAFLVGQAYRQAMFASAAANKAVATAAAMSAVVSKLAEGQGFTADELRRIVTEAVDDAVDNALEGQTATVTLGGAK